MGSLGMRSSSALHWIVAAAMALSLFTANMVGSASSAARAAQTSLPAVLGWSPGITRDVPIVGPITLYFNRAMNRESAQAAWSLTPGVAGSFSWSGTALSFHPARPLRADASYRLTIGTTARDASGIPLSGPFSV